MNKTLKRREAAMPNRHSLWKNGRMMQARIDKRIRIRYNNMAEKQKNDLLMKKGQKTDEKRKKI